MLYSVNHKNVLCNDNYHNLSGIYGHGELESLLEYDLLVTDSISELNKIFNFFTENIELEMKLTDNSNKIHDVRLYLWKGENLGNLIRILGLVLLMDDVNGINVAKQKQLKRKNYV